MELKEKLKKIMERDFGITTDAQLNEAFEKLDLSELGIFTEAREEKDVS